MVSEASLLKWVKLGLYDDYSRALILSKFSRACIISELSEIYVVSEFSSLCGE